MVCVEEVRKFGFDHRESPRERMQMSSGGVAEMMMVVVAVCVCLGGEGV